MKICGIYQIQSKCKPERKYIGSAVDISSRWSIHLSHLRKNKHHSKKLQNHYNKYGEADLQLSIILGCDKEDLLKNEQYFLDAYRPYFNVCLVAGSLLGVKFSKESCEKISKSKKGNTFWIGKKHTEESKQKMSIAKLGKKASDKTRKILSQQRMGNKFNLGIKQSQERIEHRASQLRGRKLTEEQRIKLIEGAIRYNTGHKASPETRLKMSIANKGKHSMSEEHKEKIRAINTNRRIPEEQRKKLSESHKKAWADGLYKNRKARNEGIKKSILTNINLN